MKDAERWLTTKKAEVIAGTYLSDSKTTVSEYARRVVAAKKDLHKLGTAQRQEALIKAHLDGRPLGKMLLSAVLSSDVETWKAALVKELSPSTARMVFRFGRSIFNWAVADRKIPASPFSVMVKAPRVERSHKLVPLTVDQVTALAEAVPPRYKAMIIAQAGLGLRAGELCGLRVEDVVFLHREVHIRRQLSDVGDVEDEPKAGSKRTIPLMDHVQDVLAAHLAEYGPSREGYLFSTVTQGKVSQNSYRVRAFKPAVAKAGLPVGTRPHDLRHHFASMLVSDGMPAVLVADLLGHTTSTLVLSTYGHLMPSEEDHKRKAMQHAWDSVSLNVSRSRDAQVKTE